MKKLGLYIPPPEVSFDHNNPRGHFEPRWVVDFHNRQMRKANVVNGDAMPDCVERVVQHASGSWAHDDLRNWLRGHLDQPQILVKDPRQFMFAQLWRDVAEDLGIRTVVITMLRHPAEYADSQRNAYHQGATGDVRRRREVTNVARWLNVVSLTEQTTRDLPRVYVRYTDLLADWRAPIRVCADRLGLQLNADISASEHHPVDDFIEPTLRRARTTWDDLDLPPVLQELADRLWQRLSAEAESPSDPDDLAAEVDDIRVQYVRLHDHATGVAADWKAASVRKAEQDAARKAKKEQQVAAEQSRQAEQAGAQSSSQRDKPAQAGAGPVETRAGSNDAGQQLEGSPFRQVRRLRAAMRGVWDSRSR